MLVLIQFGGSTNLPGPGTDYPMVILYKFGRDEGLFFTTKINNPIPMYERFQMDSAPN